jgi:N-acetylglucosaminyldiphosphoundecaprenol N-acetyl-beta-D-mannosaminyltransferase
MAETIGRAQAAMRGRTRLQHVALNVAKLVNLRSDPILRSDVMASDLIGIDGMGIVFAARLFGIPVKERVAGVDLFQEVLAVCATDGFRPFFLGATSEVLHRAVDVIGKKFTTIQIAGLRDGYFHPDQEEEVVKQIMNSKADCLFIAMPTPRKERFLAAYRDRLGVPFIMGIGGSLDVISGYVRRAPPIMQSMGCEWLYRIYQEPGRLWWRYARTNSLFVGILIRRFVHRWSVGLQRRLFRSG